LASVAAEGCGEGWTVEQLELAEAVEPLRADLAGWRGAGFQFQVAWVQLEFPCCDDQG
jgi:hypothetical protein